MKEIATLAGGCFWCTEGIFKRLRGVDKVTSGYSGGTKDNPTYWDVVSKKTGHAESIQIEFDPKIISFGKILDVFWNTHNPTTPDQQGYDRGSEYRSVIFYYDQKQKEVAEKSKKEFERTSNYKDPIVTEIIPFKKFYPAEDYHQNYYDNNRYQPYCMLVVDPKIQKLLKEYKKELKEEYSH